jgi:hypothetical protein
MLGRLPVKSFIISPALSAYSCNIRSLEGPPLKSLISSPALSICSCGSISILGRLFVNPNSISPYSCINLSVCSCDSMCLLGPLIKSLIVSRVLFVCSCGSISILGRLLVNPNSIFPYLYINLSACSYNKTFLLGGLPVKSLIVSPALSICSCSNMSMLGQLLVNPNSISSYLSNNFSSRFYSFIILYPSYRNNRGGYFVSNLVFVS